MTDEGHATDEILLVLGAARSGTSLLSRLLLDYFDYGMGPEGDWIAPLAGRAHRYGDLGRDENLERLVDDILREEMFETVRRFYPERFGRPVDVSREKVLRAVGERTYGGVARAALAVLARELGRRRVGSKYPGFARQLSTLDRVFGERAKYLAIARDGRDVALSTMKQPWGQNSWYANALVWVDTYRRLDELQGRLPEGRMLSIRYEDLLRDPERICRRLEAFLDAPLDDERRGALVAEITEGARSDNYEKWRSSMSDRDHRLYESVAGPWLERLGYRRVARDARARAWERAWYVGAEYARRARRKLAAAIGLAAADVPTRTDPDAEGS